MQVLGPLAPLASVPGVPVPVVLDVFNDSDIIDGFALEVVGLELVLDNGEVLTPTVVAAPAQLSIFPETSGALTAIVTVPSGYPSGLRGGEVIVRSVSRPDEVHRVPIELDVAVVPAASLLPVPQTVTGGRRAILGLVVENEGNVPLELALTLTDAENVLRGPPGTEARAEVAPIELDGEPDVQPPELPPEEPFLVRVAPRERADVRLPVAGKRPFLGTPATRVVTFTADPGTDVVLEPLQAVSTFIQKPLIPRALLTIATLLVALLAWGALLLAGVDRTTDEIADDNANLAAQQAATEMDAAAGSDADAAAALAAATGGTIAGTVTDTAGDPVTDATVVVAGDGAGETTTLSDGDAGTFEIANLPATGQFTVTASRDGFVARTVEIELTEDGPAATDLTIVLASVLGSVSGTVSDAAGAPLPNVAVRIVDGASQPVGLTTTAAAGSVGFFRVDGLAVPGSYTLTFVAPGYTDKTQTVPMLADGEPVTLDVALVPVQQGSLSGLVSEDIVRSQACTPASCPLGAVAVTVSAADGSEVGTAMTTGDGAGAGRFQIADLVPGTYTVTFAKDGYDTQAVEATVPEGGSTAVDVVLVGLPGSITGLAPGCERVEIRTRDLRQLNPSRAAQPVGADGVYGFGELGTRGEYRLLFFGPQSGDFRDIQLVDVNLGPGEQRDPVTASCQAAPPSGTGGPVSQPVAAVRTSGGDQRDDRDDQ